MEKLLGAVLIVKNEARAIQKTLKSIAPHVDAVTVLDTGSTDATVRLIREFFTKTPLVLVEEPFVDYAHARNRALAVAAERNPTAFTLTLSADETLYGGEALRVHLEAHRGASENAYCIMLQSGPRQWPFPRVLRTGGGWKFVNTSGKLNEQPVGPKGEVEGPLIPGVRVVHEQSDPERKHRRLREIDLPDLTAVVEDESKSLDDRAESIFQLAETHFILGEKDAAGSDGRPVFGGRWLSHKFASMALYTRYAEIAEQPSSRVHDPKRAAYARCMYCFVAESFGLFEPTEMVKRLRLVAACAPELPEAHWLLAKNQFHVDPKGAIVLAARAAKVARQVYDHPVHGPVDVTLEWKSYALAAKCAQEVKDRRLQQEFTKQALTAGAPREFLAERGLLESV